MSESNKLFQELALLERSLTNFDRYSQGYEKLAKPTGLITHLLDFLDNLSVLDEHLLKFPKQQLRPALVNLNCFDTWEALGTSQKGCMQRNTDQTLYSISEAELIQRMTSFEYNQAAENFEFLTSNQIDLPLNNFQVEQLKQSYGKLQEFYSLKRVFSEKTNDFWFWHLAETLDIKNTLKLSNRTLKG